MLDVKQINTEQKLLLSKEIKTLEVIEFIVLCLHGRISCANMFFSHIIHYKSI